MMGKSYLPTDRFLYLLFGLIFLLWMGWWGHALLFLLLSLLYLFAHRKIDLPRTGGNREFDDLVKSPVNGQVISIREGVNHQVFGQDLSEVSLIIPHFFESGLYLPIHGEIEYSKKFPFREHFRYRKSSKWGGGEDESYRGALVTIRGPEGRVLGLQMVKCFLGLAPKIWILPGDKGKAGARFGHFPLGGSIFCYFSKDYKVITKVGDKLRGGESVLAKERVDTDAFLSVQDKDKIKDNDGDRVSV